MAIRSDLRGPHLPETMTPETMKPETMTPETITPDLTDPALAFALLQEARECGQLIGILRGAGRLDRIARLTVAFASALPEAFGGTVDVLVLPPVDVLPYDLVAPSSRAVGARVAALTRLAEPATGPRLLLTSATASLQRVRPAGVWRAAALTLSTGELIDRAALRGALAVRAYQWDERVDEPGDAALRGRVIDIFPSGETEAIRLHLDDTDRIARITGVDGVTLRSTLEYDRVTLRPATEFRIDADGLEAATSRLEADSAAAPVAQHLPRRLQSIFEAMPDAAIYCGPDVPERWRSVRDAIDDAYAAARKAGRVTGDAGDLPPPDKLFLTVDEVTQACGLQIDLGPPQTEDLPAPHRIDALLEAIANGSTDRVLIAAPEAPESVVKSLRRRGVDAELAGMREIAAGTVTVITADPLSGLSAPGLLMLPIGPLLRPKASATLSVNADAPRVGETVVHVDHGVCRVVGLRAVGDEDCLVLEFADQVEVLIPPTALDRVWRYGDCGSQLDRAGGSSWLKRRVKIETELHETAAKLHDRVAARQAATAPVLLPDPERFAAVARRFPFPLSNDQRAASHAVRADLASGQPTDRLLCGDVGFGKTEIAIRAAAAAALAGHQVALLAPTSVLARQHLALFQARFAGTGIRVEGLIRAEQDTAAVDLRRAIAAGEVHIVIGTQGLVGTTFHAPGLVIIDEEQRFGEDDKAALAGLAPHVLAMTATPIPRTLQAALVGLREVSLLATPPQARQPIRTFVLSWDDIVVREALLRERRRDGQSFIVCPRIADIAPLQSKLAELVPELDIVVAHGRQKPEVLENAMVDFAAGRGDILIATDIIEAGLDIPRANLMIVTHSERFGLAQLHQLRGRVGRGTRRGAAYLLTEPGATLAPATQQRLETMQTLSGLGDGVAISAADLNLRGAGDLFGGRQAGHVRAVGTELYQHLLLEAVSLRKGEPPRRPAPELHVELAGRIPPDYVPDENLRIALLRRLFRLEDLPSLRQFADELQDRFGPPPASTEALLAIERLRLIAQGLQLSRVDAGPTACALTPIDRTQGEAMADTFGGKLSKHRVLIPLAERDPVARAQKLAELLGA